MKVANLVVTILYALFMAGCDALPFFFGLGLSLFTMIFASIEPAAFAGAAAITIVCLLVIVLCIPILVLAILAIVRSKNHSAHSYAVMYGIIITLGITQVAAVAIMIFGFGNTVNNTLNLNFNLYEEFWYIILWPGIGAIFLIAMIVLTVLSTKKIKEDRDFQALMEGYRFN